MAFQITIIGMDQVGTSIGLALGEYKEKIFRVGHDRSTEKLKSAQKLGAVDKIENNLPNSIAQADLILLCEPLTEKLNTLDILAPELNSGKYVFDLGWNKQAINSKILQVAPNIQHALNMLLTVNPKYLVEDLGGSNEPQADFFQHGMMVISTSKFTSSEAVDLANTLAGMLKTGMMFCDPVELDGLATGTQQLPAILGASFVHVTQNQPGWREARKFTDRGYFATSLPVDLSEENGSTGKVFLENKENLTRWIDAEILELQNVKEMLAASDEEAMTAWWNQATRNRGTVLNQRMDGNWEASEKPATEIPSFSERMGNLIGLKKKKSS